MQRSAVSWRRHSRCVRSSVVWPRPGSLARNSAGAPVAPALGGRRRPRSRSWLRYSVAGGVRQPVKRTRSSTCTVCSVLYCTAPLHQCTAPLHQCAAHCTLYQLCRHCCCPQQGCCFSWPPENSTSAPKPVSQTQQRLRPSSDFAAYCHQPTLLPKYSSAGAGDNDWQTAHQRTHEHPPDVPVPVAATQRSAANGRAGQGRAAAVWRYRCRHTHVRLRSTHSLDKQLPQPPRLTEFALRVNHALHSSSPLLSHTRTAQAKCTATLRPM